MTKDCKKDGTRKRPTKVVERKGKKEEFDTRFQKGRKRKELTKDCRNEERKRRDRQRSVGRKKIVQRIVGRMEEN